MSATPTADVAATAEAGPVLAHSLERWCAHDWSDGLQLPDLAPLERIFVRTCNHHYEIIVLDPGRAEVLVRGGRYFPEFSRARVSGSSLGGGFLKLYGIHAGFCLELHADNLAIVTSPVQRIARAAERRTG